MIALSKEDKDKMRIFSGSSSKELAKKIAEYLEIDLSSNQIVKFADGETFVKSNESIRGCKVFVIQSTSKPVNESLMELLIFIDALRRASAKEITAVIPYYGYARQDRKASPREPITSKLVANLLTVAGATRVITMDLHARQIQGFFDIPVDHMEALPILAKHFIKYGFNPEDTVVVIDTAGTICNAAQALIDKGATEVYGCATHAVFSGPAIERLKNSAFTEVVVTDSIELPEDKIFNKLRILTASKMFAEIIKRIATNKAISDLFEIPTEN